MDSMRGWFLSVGHGQDSYCVCNWLLASASTNEVDLGGGRRWSIVRELGTEEMIQCVCVRA